jgi:endonuclease/exonuclease/phosphatase family metal-dependent hydrolase
MTRILSYNILIGGTHRTDQLSTIMRATGADIIGLAEATDPQVAEELAERLGMHLCLSGQAKHASDWQVGMLSRLPIVEVRTHTRPDIFTRQHLLEVCVEETDGKQLTVFMVHLTAHFYKGTESDRIRRAEMQEILNIMTARRGTPHLLMGDFNAIAPGESFKASILLPYMMNPGYPKRYKDFIKRTGLDFVIRSSTQIFESISRNTFFSAVADTASLLYAPRAGIELLHSVGYVDCYRRIQPEKSGFTFPARTPAARIDFIFASPELAERLSGAYVVVKVAGVRGDEASDHLPVFAEFA